MSSPWSDPQFYIVTAAALGGLWMVVRPFLKRPKDQAAGCPTCTTCSVTGSSRNRPPAEGPSSLVSFGSDRR